MEYAFVTVLWHAHPQTEPAEGQAGKTGDQKGWGFEARSGRGRETGGQSREIF